MGLFKKKVAGYETYGKAPKENFGLITDYENIEKAQAKAKEQKKSNLKEGLKRIGSSLKGAAHYMIPPKTAEQIAYEQKLRTQTAEAGRKAFLKESVKQATAQAQAQAKKKYGSVAQSNNSASPINIVVKGKMSKKEKAKLKTSLKDAMQQTHPKPTSQKPADPMAAILGVGVPQQPNQDLKKKMKDDKFQNLLWNM